VLWLSLPTVSVFAPSSAEPVPASEPMVTPPLCLLISSFALPLSVIVAVLQVDVFWKEITPPLEPFTPPLAVILAFAAVVLSMKSNVVADSPTPIAPLMTKVALSAVAVLSKRMKAPCSPLVLPPTVVKVPSPALEKPSKSIWEANCWFPPIQLPTMCSALLLPAKDTNAAVLRFRVAFPPLELSKNAMKAPTLA
jgi:hypothetical protein